MGLVFVFRFWVVDFARFQTVPYKLDGVFSSADQIDINRSIASRTMNYPRLGAHQASKQEEVVVYIFMSLCVSLMFSIYYIEWSCRAEKPRLKLIEKKISLCLHGISCLNDVFGLFT